MEKSAQFAVPLFLFLALFPSAAPVYELVSYFPLSCRLSSPVVPSFLPPVKTGKDGWPVSHCGVADPIVRTGFQPAWYLSSPLHIRPFLNLKLHMFVL